MAPSRSITIYWAGAAFWLGILMGVLEKDLQAILGEVDRLK